MTDLASVDYFSDPAVAQDPYEYYDFLRSRGPVTTEPHYGVVAVTGYQEVMAAFKDHDSFSAVNAIGGPFPPLPFTPEGDDITEQIEAHRHLFPIHEHMVVMDPPAHERARSLLSKLLTPRRLKENEDFMWQLVDRQLDAIIGNQADEGRCEFLSEYAKPFATSAIIDLLGVPEEDRAEFLEALGAAPREGARVGALDGEPVGLDPLQYLDCKFAGYLAERRREPRGDVLSGMATATYPDGSTPDLMEVVKPATFLFAAGQETVTKLLSSAVQTLAERPEFQERLRKEPDLIPVFIEEALRTQSPTKVDFRLARKTRRSAAWRSRPARSSCCAWVRPTAIRASSRIRTSSASTGRTSASTSRSAVASTPVPARRWRVSRARSPCGACWIVCGTSGSTPHGTARPTAEPMRMSRRSCCAVSPSCTSSTRRLDGASDSADL